MADASNYLEAKIAAALGGTAFSISARYVQMHTGYPGEAGLIAASLTPRVSMAVTSVAGVVSNSAIVAFDSVPDDETWTHFSVWDASTGGNCLIVAALVKNVVVQTGADAAFTIGDLTISIL